MNRLPEPETPLGIDGKRYRYRFNHLGRMCTDVQNIEQVSKVSRANIQNIFILLQFYTGQLLNGVQLGFNKILGDYIDKNKPQRPKERPSIDTQEQKKCDCDKDYKDFVTGIIQDIRNYSSFELFSKSPEIIVEEISEKLSDKTIQERGFERIIQYEDQCYQHQGHNEELREANIENDTQVEILQDTLRDVQYGDQGGCWFIDRYGLITGIPGDTIIRLYQMTGLDEIGYPAPEAVCPVFVTDLEGLYFLWADWSQPTKRAICLKAELVLLYDEDFFSQSESHLYWLTEEEVEANLKPRPLSAKLYMGNLMDLMRVKDEIDELEAQEDQKIINKYLKEIEYSEDGIYVMRGRSESAYQTVLEYSVFGKNMSMEDWYLNFNMNIGISKNRKYIDGQQWVGNIDKNRDSFGFCVEDSYACLKVKDVPIYGADRKKWEERAVEEIQKVKTDIENKVRFSADFNMGIKTIEELHYSLDTLVKAGYGSKQLRAKEQLYDLNKFLKEVNRLSLKLLTNKEEDSSDSSTNKKDSFDSQVQNIKELDAILTMVVDRIKQDSEMPLIPNVSSQEYGFGFPQDRAQALKAIRSDFKEDQCRYQEGMQ